MTEDKHGKEEEPLRETLKVTEGGEENDEDNDDIELEEDVYAVIYVEGFGIPFLYALGTAIMQLVIVALFFVDIKGNSPENRLNLPLAVDLNVRLTQFLALPLCVMAHEDCTTALYLLRAKWQLDSQFPSATKRAWVFSLVLRFAVGYLLVFMSFVQVMQATNNTDLFLNLEAIVFVGNVDNFAFWLAEKGFLTQSLKDAAERTRDVKMKAARGKRRARTKRTVFIVSWLILVLGWAASWFSEFRGRTLSSAACKRFTVQFGDESLLLDGTKIQLSDTVREMYTPSLMEREHLELLYSYFSGTYELGYRMESSRYPFVRHKRAVYTEVIADYDRFTAVNDRSLGRFEFCTGEGNFPGAWVFKIDGLNNAWERDEEGEDCKNWLLRSPPTSESQLENVPTDGWKIWTSDGVAEPANFNLECNDCQRLVDCNFNGDCKDGQCKCDPGFFGNNCFDDTPCDSIQIEFMGDSSWDYRRLGSFRLLQKNGTLGPLTTEKDAQLVYGRPVYLQTGGFASLQDVLTADGEVEVVYYSGSRWTLSSLPAWRLKGRFLPELNGRKQGPHSFWEELSEVTDSQFFSEFTTDKSPAGDLRWYQVLKSRSRGDYGPYGFNVEVKLNIQCSGDCDPDPDLRSCGLNGNCTDGVCQCNNCFGGYYCEYAPDDVYTQEQWFTAVVNDGEPLGFEDTYFASFWSNPEQCPESLKALWSSR